MNKQGLKVTIENLWFIEYSGDQGCFHIIQFKEMLDTNQEIYFELDRTDWPGYFPLYVFESQDDAYKKLDDLNVIEEMKANRVIKKRA